MRHKMREYNKEEYREKMVQVYGEFVVRDFEKFEYRKKSKFPETYDSFKERMRRYVFRIGAQDKKNKGEKLVKKVSNFNTHSRFARFVLISIEKYYGKTKINLAKIESKSENEVVYEWETEHILPQADKNKVDVRYIRSLGNLTLISRGLNGDEKYKNAEYKVKCRYFLKKGDIEKTFYLNRFFDEKDKFDIATVEERYEQLKREFKNIFIDSTNAEFTLSSFEEIIGVHEMDNGE